MNFGAHVEHCTEQMGVPGPSHERLPHFRPGYLEPIGNELQTEYFLPRRHAPAAIRAIEALRASITPHLFISEVRSIAADEFWMSPCYERHSVSIHFTWKHHEADVKRLVPIIEQALAPFDPRPHWGKMFAMAPALLQSKYPKLENFRRLARRFDPEGKLRNPFLDINIFSPLTARL
jgi:xylitol oxidase